MSLTKFFSITITWLFMSISIGCADIINGFRDKSDGKIGTFQQSDSGDCFFLASILALANDSEGKLLVESTFDEVSEIGKWRVTFPNIKDLPMTVSQKEVDGYIFPSTRGLPKGELVSGDIDVKLLQIAADKIWKKLKIKPQGLWDDVPMNALAMFTDVPQRLIWNRKLASSLAINDIDKYKRLPQGMVQEQQVTSYKKAYEAISSIIKEDSDGISMVLLDYIEYHGIVIVSIDLNNMQYTYVDPLKGSGNILKSDLKTLLMRVVSGKYAINYVEIPKLIQK